jgi:hypothetical protein
MSSLRELSLCEQDMVSGGGKISEFLRTFRIDPQYASLRYDPSAAPEDQIVIKGRHSNGFIEATKDFALADLLQYTGEISGLGAAAYTVAAVLIAPELATAAAAYGLVSAVAFLGSHVLNSAGTQNLQLP